MPKPELVEHVLENLDVTLRETTAKITSRRGIWDPLSTQAVQKNFVVSSELDVLEAGAATKRVVGDVQDMIRFVIWEVLLEE